MLRRAAPTLPQRYLKSASLLSLNRFRTFVLTTPYDMQGVGGVAGATPEACQSACCAHPLCAAFTHVSFQQTATPNCAHGKPCCWLKASYVPIPGSMNETTGQIHRPPNIASPASIPIRVLTEVTILHAGGTPVINLTTGESVVCTLAATAGGWARDAEAFGGGVVLNASAVRCPINATAELGGPASIRAVSTYVPWPQHHDMHDACIAVVSFVDDQTDFTLT